MVEAIDGRDKDKDNKVVVACPALVPGDKANLVSMIAISVANRVTAERSALSFTSEITIVI